MGACLWLAALWLAPFTGFAGVWKLGPTLLVAPLILVPLAIGLVVERDRDGFLPVTLRGADVLQVPAALAAAAALCLPPSWTAALLASLWFGQTLLLAGFGLRRLAWHGVLCAGELAISAGLLYLAVGGFWLVAHVAGWTFGFNGLIVFLTAVHFHFAGLVLGVVTGMTGRMVPWTAGRWRVLFRFAAGLIVVAPGLVGIGIAAAPWIEVVAAGLLAVAVIALGLTILKTVSSGTLPPAARVGLALAGMSGFATMFFAVWYALGEFGVAAPVPLDRMVRWHGWINAYLFGLAGLASLAIIAPASRFGRPWPPFSRLRASRFVGADFFEREDLSVVRTSPASGLMDSIEEHRRLDFDPAAVPRPIRDFYEHTSRWALRVQPRWQPGFRLAGRAFRWVAGRLGQLNLPVGIAHETDMTSRLMDLSDAADGRSNVRGWVRQFRATGQPVYVAAYSTHRAAGVAYMNIAFPLPGGNLTSVLRLDHDRDGGVRLDSRPRSDTVGDEGVYLVLRRVRIRLPLQETIVVTCGRELDGTGGAGRESGGSCTARHDMWLFGWRYLRLDYVLTPPPGA